MNITVKLLTPERAADYFDFFEARAFTDDSPYRCYCQVYQMSKAEYGKAFNNLAGDERGRVSRTIAAQQIAAGILQGYLAYADGVAIGWCNANDRANYPAEPQYDVPFHAPKEKREKAVTCFEIAPEYRKKGVATALLQQVIADAKAEGCSAVVGFPVLYEERFEWDSRGPVRLYEKVGFIKMAEQNGYAVMIKKLP